MEFIRRNVNAESKGESSGGNIGGIANVTSSSTSLATHTIFGQPFNGTQDVRGDLKDANNIIANGNVSTDGDLIVKGVDEEGVYNNIDLHISQDEDGAYFSGSDTYNYDNNIIAPKFIGDVDAESINTTTLEAYNGTIENLTATEAKIDAL